MRNIAGIAVEMFALGTDIPTAGLLGGIAASFGVPITVAAQTIVLFTLSYAIAGPVLSSYLSGLPMRKILLYTMAGLTISNLVCAISFDIWLLLVSRVFAGAFSGAFSPAASYASTLVAGKNNKARSIGIVYAGKTAGTVMGVPLGVLIGMYFDWRGMRWAGVTTRQHILITSSSKMGSVFSSINASCVYLGTAVGAEAGSFLLLNNVSPLSLPLFSACVIAGAFAVQGVRTRKKSKQSAVAQ